MKKLLSFILAIVMLLSIFAGLNLTAYAQEQTLEFIDRVNNETYSITVDSSDTTSLIYDVVADQIGVSAEDITIIYGTLENRDCTVAAYVGQMTGWGSRNCYNEIVFGDVWGEGDNYDAAWLGDYESATEYHISNAMELAAFKKACWTDYYTFEGKTVYLDNDINLDGHYWLIEAVEAGIGENEIIDGFSGVFEGRNHLIFNVSMYPVGGGVCAAALFPYTYNAVIKNLTVSVDIAFANSSYIGGLIGYARDTGIINCCADGQIDCLARKHNYRPAAVGGLIGTASHCAIINCYADTSIVFDSEESVENNLSWAGEAYIGGLIGELNAYSKAPFCLLNSCSFGSIDIKGKFENSERATVISAGGLVGLANDDIYNCYSVVNIDAEIADYVGEIAGTLNAEYITKVTDEETQESREVNLGEFIIGSLYYENGKEPFGTVINNDSGRDVSQFASEYNNSFEETNLKNMLRNGEEAVNLIISEHREILNDSAWADLLVQCNADDIIAKDWRNSTVWQMPVPKDNPYYYGSFYYRVTEDKNVIISGYLLRNNTDVVVPSKIINLPVTTIDVNAFNGKSITSVVIPNGITDISGRAFAACNELKSVTIADTVTNIGPSAFRNCKSLTDISLPEGIEEIYGYTFDGCDSLESIDIPDKVTKIYYAAFSNCTALESVNFGSGLECIDQFAFYNCSSLSSINIPNGVTEIWDYAFADCINLTEISIPESVTSIKTGVFSNTGYYNDESNWENSALYIGDVLVKVDFRTATGAYEIKDGTRLTVDAGGLNGCWQITSITLPSSLKYYGAYALSGCSNLKKVVIPEGAEVLGAAMFDGCRLLREITIPTSVTVIHSDFADNCKYLTDIYFTGTKAEWDEIQYKPEIIKNGEGVPVTLHFSDDPVEPEPEPEPLTGWQYIDGVWYYYNADGEIVTGWLKDGGKWYFLDEDGVMQTGWIKDGSTWYYLNKSGAMQTGWLKDGNNWYYLKSNGSMATGWIKDGGKWYYLKSSGAMATGWLLYKNNWYYLDASGAMRTANLTYKGKVYKFNASGVCLNP